ncbi:hypothetical protein AVEN_77779-1 [Araneus ventricosus]|uniref:HTH psq-type domain-containing protein n=1 Tax=Araneus ventricosus TaxID=182803 RepID=A0A4Y2RW15_ARAVE|nr:hypothetical protein AVEN_77779-1 [Araneus ventricosus]
MKTIVRSNLKSVSDVYSWIEEYGRTSDTKWNPRSSRPSGTRLVCWSPSTPAIPTAGSGAILSLSPSTPSCRKFHSIVPLCRKFHSSPRPSAFLLATFCPTQKRWLYRIVEHSVMPWDPINEYAFCYQWNRSSKLVRRIEAGETLTNLSTEFGVGVSTVRDMRRQSCLRQSKLPFKPVLSVYLMSYRHLHCIF